MIKSIIQKNGFVILDGALATELEKAGCDLNHRLWSAKILAEDPDRIKRVHQLYFEAGADCAITSSYQAVPDGFLQAGFSSETAKSLIQLTFSLAVNARDSFWESYSGTDRPKPFVAASIGPYGAYLADGSEYRGGYSLTKEELIAFHRPRVELLVEAGADFFACETLPSLLEAEALVDLLTEYPGVSAWFSFSCKDGAHISDGTPIESCAAMLDHADVAAAVGINCTPLHYAEELVQRLSSKTDKPVIVYPNSGEIYDASTNQWHGDSSVDSFQAHAETWADHGAGLIGGCCRTGPDEIRQLTALRCRIKEGLA
ncbi:homocysteine S-methyltransferase [Alkalicoccus luteus]|uniref:homocysteine S-methyltransferase n=1 Tax=Alkalicoccus luteus TaxID=1237094 RepID=UPI004034BD52